jgi:hypothetical protein
VQVIAVTTPSRPDWRWRIVNYAGEVVQESYHAFPTIGEAVAAGARRLLEIDVVDRSVRSSPGRSTSHLRGR